MRLRKLQSLDALGPGLEMKTLHGLDYNIDTPLASAEYSRCVIR